MRDLTILPISRCVACLNPTMHATGLLQILRGLMDSVEMTNVQIVAADGGFSGISADVQKDPKLKAAVSVLGSVIRKKPRFSYI